MTDQTNQAEASKTIDEAIDSLSTTAINAVNEAQRQREVYKELSQVLTQRLDIAHRHRDELASCLREVLDMMSSGAIVIAPGQLLGNAFQYMTLANRCQAALMRLEVRERLEDRLEAERKEAHEPFSLEDAKGPLGQD